MKLIFALMLLPAAAAFVGPAVRRAARTVPTASLNGPPGPPRRGQKSGISWSGALTEVTAGGSGAPISWWDEANRQAAPQEGPTGAIEFCPHAPFCGWEVVLGHMQ